VAPSKQLEEAIAKANAEADEVEEVDEDTEAELTEDEEAGDEPEVDEDEASMEKMRADLEHADDVHDVALATIYGDAWDAMTACPLCLAHGYVPAEQPPDLPPEQILAVLAAAGAIAQGMKPHPDFVRCDLCDGIGKLATGARNDDGNNYVACPRCTSRGYVNPKEIATQEQAQRDALMYQTAPPIVPTPTPLANGSPGLPGSPDQQPWYDHVSGQWKLP